MLDRNRAFDIKPSLCKLLLQSISCNIQGKMLCLHMYFFKYFFRSPVVQFCPFLSVSLWFSPFLLVSVLFCLFLSVLLHKFCCPFLFFFLVNICLFLSVLFWFCPFLSFSVSLCPFQLVSIFVSLFLFVSVQFCLILSTSVCCFFCLFLSVSVCSFHLSLFWSVSVRFVWFHPFMLDSVSLCKCLSFLIFFCQFLSVSVSFPDCFIIFFLLLVSVHLCQFWSVLVHFSGFYSVYVHLCPFLFISVCFCPFLVVSVHLGFFCISATIRTSWDSLLESCAVSRVRDWQNSTWW